MLVVLFISEILRCFQTDHCVSGVPGTGGPSVLGDMMGDMMGDIMGDMMGDMIGDMMGEELEYTRVTACFLRAEMIRS